MGKEMRDHTWFRRVRSQNEEGKWASVDSVNLRLEDPCWFYQRLVKTDEDEAMAGFDGGQVGVQHEGIARPVRVWLYIMRGRDSGGYMGNPLGVFIRQGCDPMVVDEVAKALKIEGKWCGVANCVNPGHAVLVPRGEWLGWFRDRRVQERRVAKANKLENRRERLVPNLTNSGHTLLGPLVDGLYLNMTMTNFDSVLYGWTENGVKKQYKREGWYADDDVWAELMHMISEFVDPRIVAQRNPSWEPSGGHAKIGGLMANVKTIIEYHERRTKALGIVYTRLPWDNKPAKYEAEVDYETPAQAQERAARSMREVSVTSRVRNPRPGESADGRSGRVRRSIPLKPRRKGV